MTTGRINQVTMVQKRSPIKEPATGVPCLQLLLAPHNALQRVQGV